MISGHINYARYISWYVYQEKIPHKAEEPFITSNAQVCRHQPSVWSSVSQDQFGEQTYIR